ncbi:sugar ABC transporter permease [Martelella mediterranea]|nr:sugar ABC transporter permease [Martelella mediterranea]
MLSPALLFLLAFFFAPVVLTAVFSFTNMTSATGITGGAYVISPNALRNLEWQGMDKAVTESLSGTSITVDEAALSRAAEAGVEPDFLEEIESRLMGAHFDDARSFERELKTLPNRPRRIRDLKLAAEPFGQSILNTRFATRDQAVTAIDAVAPDLTEAQRDAVLTQSYTGWVWTTDNFKRLATTPATGRLLTNTALYVGLTLSIFNVGLGLFLAIAIFYMPKTSGSVFSVLWLLPRITPVVLYAVMWRWFTWDDGFLPTIAAHLGLPSFNYMKGSVPTAWATIITLNGFIGASFGMILFSGALRAIPVQQLWASEVDGASRWQQVRKIILPQLKWPILFVTCYQSLSLLSSYQEIWLTTNGGPGNTTNVWALEAFRIALSNFTGNLEYGLGAAMALVLVVVGLALSIIFLRLFKFGEMLEKPKIEF